MTKKSIAVLVLVVVLIGLVTLEQVYTDNAVNAMLTEVQNLTTQLQDENLDASKRSAQKIITMWDENEKVISLFVDFRDIEQIGRQADLVLSHLNNQDFELAKVECNTLKRVVETFNNSVKVDWQNVI
ncbi:MAG: DUF4363 family protein [Clostridia bacterium]|nr:DUF4363 family protein [Clostridia bacterium]